MADFTRRFDREMVANVDLQRSIDIPWRKLSGVRAAERPSSGNVEKRSVVSSANCVGATHAERRTPISQRQRGDGRMRHQVTRRVIRRVVPCRVEPRIARCVRLIRPDKHEAARLGVAGGGGIAALDLKMLPKYQR